MKFRRFLQELTKLAISLVTVIRPDFIRLFFYKVLPICNKELISLNNFVSTQMQVTESPHPMPCDTGNFQDFRCRQCTLGPSPGFGLCTHLLPRFSRFPTMRCSTSLEVTTP